MRSPVSLRCLPVLHVGSLLLLLHLALSAATAPTITGLPASLATDKGLATAALPFTIGGTSPFTLAATSTNTTLVPVANCVFGGSGTSRTVTITPASGQTGTVTIRVTVTDATTLSAYQEIALTVNPLPTVTGLPATYQTDKAVATPALPFVLANGTGTLTPTVSSSNTTLVPNANCVIGGSGANRTLTITPAASGTGTATITVTVTDGLGKTGTQAVALTVVALPVLSGLPATLALDTGVASAAQALTIANGTGPFALAATSTNTALVPVGNVVLGGSGTARTAVITAVAGQTGTTSVTITATDALGKSSAQTCAVTVNALPTMSGLVATLQTDVATATSALPFTIGNGTGTLTLSALSSNTTLVPVASCVFGGSGANRTVTITPASGQTGIATITIQSKDTLNQIASQQLVLTVVPKPTITGLQPTYATDLAIPTPALPFTLANGTGTLTVTAASSNTTLVPNANCVLGGSGANRTLTVTPAAGQTGTATITVTVTDSLAKTGTATLALTVNALPVLGGVASIPGALDSGVASVATTLSITGGTAPFTMGAATTDAVLIPVANVVFGGSGAAPTVVVTPAAGQTGTATITLTATDARGQASSKTRTITVSAVPTMTGLTAALQTDVATATSDLPFTIGGGTGTLTLSALSSNTTLVPVASCVFGGSGASRTVTITPAASQTGTATITIRSTDTLNQVASQQLVLTVVPKPTITGLAATAGTDVGTTALPLTFTVSNGTGAMTVTAAASNTTLIPNANCVVSGTGPTYTLTVTPAATGTGTTTITVTATDSLNKSGTATCNMTVNARPTLTGLPGSATVNIGVPTSAQSFTIGSGTGTLTLSANSSNPTLIPNANCVFGGSGASRTVTITPAPGQMGVADVAIIVTDGVGVTASMVIRVTVNAIPASVTTQPANVTLAKGATATFTVVATGTPPLTYQWSRSNDAGVTWTPIAGATSTSYGYVIGYADTASRYRCAVSNATLQGGATATSNAAILTVTNAAPSLVSMPVASGPAGPQIGLSVVATDDDGEANLTYTWTQVDGPATVTFVSGNGRNAGKAIQAMFPKVGTYHVHLVIQDLGGLQAIPAPDLAVQVTSEPFAVPDQRYGCESDIGYFQGNIVATAPGGGAMTYALSTPAHGSVTLENGTAFKYIPTPGYRGIDTFTVTATETATGAVSQSGTVTMMVGIDPTRSVLVRPAAVETFNASQYMSNGAYQAAYLALSAPGRVWATAQGAAGVPMLQLVGPASVSCANAGTITLSAVTAPDAPVTFAATANGAFPGSVNAITVKADKTGLASVLFTSPPLSCRCPVLIGSPLAVGTQRVVVEVQP